MKSRVYRA